MENENSFWKQNNRALPGRIKDQKVVNKGGNKVPTSFQDFQESVQDAWDMGSVNNILVCYPFRV